MKTDKRTQLLKILSDTSQSISSAALANMLGTSERTVRNYIKAINEEGKAVITSSREGHRLESHTASLDTLPNKAESRVWKVLSDLLTSKEGVNAFDEAEALYVSSSTILNTVIPQVKEIAKEYDLRIESQKYQFYLRGSEQNRRKMIGSLAVRNTYGFFNSKDALEQLFPSQDIDGIMQELFTTCQESKLFLNDFALNNLLIHILVILIRLNIGNELDDKEPPISVDELLASSQDREDIVNLADMISANFEQKYSIRIPERDYKQILMLIALSVEHETVDIQCVISPEFIHNVASILSMMSQRYCTPEFDNDYILQFSLHMYYAQQRCAFHISYPNPIALQFKKDYAPVYDMAVYFAHRFAQVLIKSPVPVEAPKKTTQERSIWEVDEMRAALDSMEDPILHLAVHLTLVGALREGEVAGLTPEDIDFDAANGMGTFTVNRSMQRVQKDTLAQVDKGCILRIFPDKLEGSKTSLILKDTKTEASCRTIFMTAALREELKQWLERLKREEALDPERYRNSGMLLRLPNGLAVEPVLIRKKFLKWQDAHPEFPRIVFHGLRHSSATYQLMISGGDIKAVQGTTGHASADMLVNTYAHIQQSSRVELGKKFESGFYAKPDTSSPQAVPAEGEPTISMTALLELLKDADPEMKAKLRLALLT